MATIAGGFGNPRCRAYSPATDSARSFDHYDLKSLCQEAPCSAHACKTSPDDDDTRPGAVCGGRSRHRSRDEVVDLVDIAQAAEGCKDSLEVLNVVQIHALCKRASAGKKRVGRKESEQARWDRGRAHSASLLLCERLVLLRGERVSSVAEKDVVAEGDGTC